MNGEKQEEPELWRKQRMYGERDHESDEERDELRAKAALADRLREDLKQAFAVESVMDVMSEFETSYDSLIQEGK